MSEPVPKSYLCQTSFIPMYINTISGSKSITSFLYLVRRSETLSPLIPLPTSFVFSGVLGARNVIKPVYLG